MIVEMENRLELALPVSKKMSHQEAIFVFTGRSFSFKPVNQLQPDFPIPDPVPDDPLSYLLERMLQLKITLERRRHSYFVFWNKHHNN